METATKSLSELNSVGDVARSSLSASLAFRGRLMQVREAAGQPYDPVAEAAADRILSLPMFPHLTGEQQERVAQELARVVRR